MAKLPKKRLSRRKKRKHRPGSRPGEIHVDSKALPSKISVMAYGEHELVEKENCQINDLEPLLRQHRVTWINVSGLGDKETLEGLAELFDIHPLAMEDVVTIPQRPKVEGFSNQLFFILHLLERKTTVRLEQASFCLGKRFVLTFQERPGDPFEPVRGRLRRGGGRLRQFGADYLAYALLDAAIDHYLPVLEQLRDHLEALETDLRTPHGEAIDKIQLARAEVLEARHAVGPAREVVRALINDESSSIAETTRLFLRDCNDHVLEAIDLLDSCHEVASGLMDIHLSTVSHQANRTMERLTAIATIFMPLSFLAGIYGMNFDPGVSRWNMPELSSPVGYPVLLGVMLVLGSAGAYYFYKKGWFD